MVRVTVESDLQEKAQVIEGKLVCALIEGVDGKDDTIGTVMVGATGPMHIVKSIAQFAAQMLGHTFNTDCSQISGKLVRELFRTAFDIEWERLSDVKVTEEIMETKPIGRVNEEDE